jgi:hypothetical protein
MKRIFWIILGIIALVLAIAYLKIRSNRRALESGAVHIHDQTGATPSDQAGQTAQPSSADSSDQQGLQTGGEAATPPANDSIPRNPPNGMTFAGAGKFQLYRQGDITWRLNTDTGEACILFATDAEWRQPRVYQHGCGAN